MWGRGGGGGGGGEGLDGAVITIGRVKYKIRAGNKGFYVMVIIILRHTFFNQFKEVEREINR